MDKHDSLKQSSGPELLWAESESLKQVTELAEKSKPSATIVVVALILMMYPYVQRDLWLIWVGLHGASLLIRTVYIEQLKSDKLENANRYHLSNLLIIGSIALTWGSTAYPLLVGERSRMEIMVLNLIFIYGIGGAINLSQHLKTMRIFLACYGAGLLGAVLATMVFSNLNNYLIDNVTIMIFMCLFVFMLNKVGTEINKSHIKTLLLQYSNKQLIESLTVEKQTAIDAVEVKNRIMASATHDMRQPILALDLYTDLLIHEPETLPVLMPKIAEATKSVITMFDAMFDLARMSMNQLTPDKARFSLQEMLIALQQQYQPMAKSKGLDLRVRLSYANRELIDDPILLRRILSNLLSNAIKYTEYGGVLLVCRDCEKYGFRVEVWDTGVGISPEMQEAVFSEFYKNPENTGTSDGFGLGLAIVSQLCVLLGHQLTMKSRRGHGTMMSVRLSNALA
jgi:signal transduction histidine kinase